MQVNPYWITGVTDAEGNFSINYNKNENKVSASFKITQNCNSSGLLARFKDYFNCGYFHIDNRSTNGLKYSVSDSDVLRETIIPHFDKYPLQSSKHLDFLDFKEAVDLLKNRTDNMQEILECKERMNRKRSFEYKWTFLKDYNFNINNDWLQGFIDGEGCFYFYLYDKEIKTILGSSRFELAQSSSNVHLLFAIKKFLGAGHLKPFYNIDDLTAAKSARSVTRLVISQADPIIDLIDNYPLYSTKSISYKQWKTLIDLRRVGPDTNQSDIDYIRDIKKHMNKNTSIVDKFSLDEILALLKQK